MNLFSIEHSKLGYWADFVVYAAAVVLLPATLLFICPPAEWLAGAGLAACGLASWSLAEYLLHRFVLHGVQPFRGWHEKHHLRPTALISAPTALSATLIAGGVFLPVYWLFGLWPATAYTSGLLAGYLSYALLHHGSHHWRFEAAWFRRRKRWHAIHHRSAQAPSCYGVTSSLWDHVFGTAQAPLDGRISFFRRARRIRRASPTAADSQSPLRRAR